MIRPAARAPPAPAPQEVSHAFTPGVPRDPRAMSAASIPLTDYPVDGAAPSRDGKEALALVDS